MKYLAMDIAASEFFKEGKYDLDFKNPETKERDWISSDQLLEMYQGNRVSNIGRKTIFNDLIIRLYP